MTYDLTPDLIGRDLPTAVVGRPLVVHAQVGSTNDLVRQQARAGQPEGLVVLAEEQTAGRGRMGRGWAAPPGSSLLLSLLLRPDWLLPADSFALTMLAGVALCEAVEQAAPLRAALKWPNDLMLPVAGASEPALRKSAGILSEIELAGDQIAWVVVGMGVNVNWAPQGFVDGRDLAEVGCSCGWTSATPCCARAGARSCSTPGAAASRRWGSLWTSGSRSASCAAPPRASSRRARYSCATRLASSIPSWPAMWMCERGRSGRAEGAEGPGGNMTAKTQRWLAPGALILGLALAACGPAGPSSQPPAASATAAPAATTPPTAQPTIAPAAPPDP